MVIQGFTVLTQRDVDVISSDSSFIDGQFLYTTVPFNLFLSQNDPVPLCYSSYGDYKFTSLKRENFSTLLAGKKSKRLKKMKNI